MHKKYCCYGNMLALVLIVAGGIQMGVRREYFHSFHFVLLLGCKLREIVKLEIFSLFMKGMNGCLI